MTALAQRIRLDSIDQLRGLAVLGMIADHLFIASLARGGPQLLEVLHDPGTRWVMPLFMIVSGYLLGRSEPSTRRLVQAAAAMLFASAVISTGLVGQGLPDILAVWLLAVVPFGWLIRRYPLACITVGVVAATTWPIDWHGYHLGAVVALLGVGVLAGRSAPAVQALGLAGARLPDWFAWVGRHALSLYCAHLLVIALVVAAL